MIRLYNENGWSKSTFNDLDPDDDDYRGYIENLFLIAELYSVDRDMAEALQHVNIGIINGEINPGIFMSYLTNNPDIVNATKV